MTRCAAIIGGGVIGGGWAARFLLMGWDVRVFDPDPQAKRKIGEVLDNARRSLPGLSDAALPEEGRLSYHDTMSGAVQGAEWIQESVPERLDLKRKVQQMRGQPPVYDREALSQTEDQRADRQRNRKDRIERRKTELAAFDHKPHFEAEGAESGKPAENAGAD